MESGGKFWILHSRPFPYEFYGGGDHSHLILDGYLAFFLTLIVTSIVLKSFFFLGIA